MMRNECTKCGALLEPNGFCPNCDSLQKEKLYKIDYSKPVVRVPTHPQNPPHVAGSRKSRPAVDDAPTYDAPADDDPELEF